MSSFSVRLREERDRLRLTQPDFGALGRVGKQSQINYESGKRLPDAEYLMAISEAGADVLYILTGERRSAVPLPAAEDLPPRLRSRLTAAIETIEAGLEATGQTLTPSAKAELVFAAYDLLAKEGETATAQIFHLFRV